MNSGAVGQPGCVGVWKAQTGRSRLQRLALADGFIGEYPYAGVVVVAEGLAPDDDPSAEITVNTVRDVFAEGVAYGIEDALQDAFREAADTIRRNGHAGCSAAAVAFSGSHAWFAGTGACRVLKLDEEGATLLAPDQSAAEAAGMGRDHPEYGKSVRELTRWLGGKDGTFVTGHTRIRKGSVVLAATPGIWMNLKEGGLLRKSSSRNLEAWLSAVTRETRAAYRRQGGAVAAASCLSGGRTSVPTLPVAAVLVMIVLGLLIATGAFEKKETVVEAQSIFTVDDPPSEVVMPLADDSVSLRPWSHSRLLSLLEDPLISIPDISSHLPLHTVLVGGEPETFSPDTFMVAHNENPNPRWENFSPGIYPLEGDTASLLLAEKLSADAPHLSIFPLSTIVVVRGDDVSATAAWLRELNHAEASRTGVIVETGSSVAGGADWIRSYPVFANGDRGRQGLPGGFQGDSLPGVPGVRAPGVYRLIIVP